MPDAEGVDKMMAYNRALQEAGVLLAMDGLIASLHPAAQIGWEAGFSMEVRLIVWVLVTLDGCFEGPSRSDLEFDELPPERELPARLASVLDVIYLVFNEGYVATSGREWIRPEFCRPALRLGRVLAGLAPNEPEVHGLVAIMELQASRLAARVGADGEAVLLMDQARARWDRIHIRRGLESLELAHQLGGAGRAKEEITKVATMTGVGEWPRASFMNGSLCGVPL